MVIYVYIIVFFFKEYVVIGIYVGLWFVIEFKDYCIDCYVIEGWIIVGGICLIGLFVCFGIVKYVVLFLLFFGFKNINKILVNGLIEVDKDWKIIYFIIKFGLLIDDYNWWLKWEFVN